MHFIFKITNNSPIGYDLFFLYIYIYQTLPIQRSITMIWLCNSLSKIVLVQNIYTTNLNHLNNNDFNFCFKYRPKYTCLFILNL